MNHNFGRWLKNNWLLIVLVALLVAAAILEEGVANGLWFAGAVCYLLAVRLFCSRAILAIALRTPLHWKDWSLLAFATAFAALAYGAGVARLAIVGGVVGLAVGVVSGLVFLLDASRARAK